MDSGVDEPWFLGPSRLLLKNSICTKNYMCINAFWFKNVFATRSFMYYHNVNHMIPHLGLCWPTT